MVVNGVSTRKVRRINGVLDFLERKENVVFLGPPDIGKIHLVISLAVAGTQSGRRVYYGSLVDLITSLKEAQVACRVQYQLKMLTHSALLIVEEINYLPVTRTRSTLFFQLVNRRHERASTVLTSNKGLEEWGETFGDEVMAALLIGRLLHYSHLVNNRGNCFRMRKNSKLW